MSAHVRRGMALHAALALAKYHGCSITHSEEWVVRHPSWRKAIRVHVGRKDASVALLSCLRKLVKKHHEAYPHLYQTAD